MLKSGTQILDSDSAAAEMGLGRWKPDFMVVSYSTKKIALGPKEYLQSNTRAENLIEAYGRNCTTCSYKVHVMIQNIMMIESRKNMVDPYASIWAYKA